MEDLERELAASADEIRNLSEQVDNERTLRAEQVRTLRAQVDNERTLRFRAESELDRFSEEFRRLQEVENRLIRAEIAELARRT